MCSGLCLAAIALQVTAIATPEWSKLPMASIPGAKGYMGLWKGCVEGNSQKMCENIPASTDPAYMKNSLYVCRAFSIASAALLTLCILNMYMSTGMQKSQTCMALLYMALICSIVVLAVWPAEMLKDKATGQKLKLGYSYFLFMGGSISVLLAVLFKHYKMGHLGM